MTNSLYNGLTSGFDQNTFLWNLSLGEKLFDNQRGELSLSVYDVLNENQSINRTITDTYIEDLTTKVLNRYYMLTFTYTLRQFRGEKSEM